MTQEIIRKDEISGRTWKVTLHPTKKGSEKFGPTVSFTDMKHNQKVSSYHISTLIFEEHDSFEKMFESDPSRPKVWDRGLCLHGAEPVVWSVCAKFMQDIVPTLKQYYDDQDEELYEDECLFGDDYQ